MFIQKSLIQGAVKSLHIVFVCMEEPVLTAVSARKLSVLCLAQGSVSNVLIGFSSFRSLINLHGSWNEPLLLQWHDKCCKNTLSFVYSQFIYYL